MTDVADPAHALLYAISHDLQAPLRHIHGYLQLLGPAFDRLPEDDRRHADALRDNARRMQRMLDAALVLSRLETEPVEPGPVDLGDALQSVRDGLQDHPRHGDVRWTVGDLPTVRADRRRVETLLRVLAKNSLDHGATHVHVHGQRVDGGARITVEDEGPGFPAKLVPRVTDLYQTLHRDDHVGAGLAIAKRIVEQHGGTLTLDAEEGRGVLVAVGLGDLG